MSYISQSKILSLFRDGTLGGKTFTGICRYFLKEGVTRVMVEGVIDSLVENGRIEKFDGRFYLAGEQKPQKGAEPQLFTGIFRANEKGFGFVTAEDGTDYFIRSDKMGQALNGDAVTFKKIAGGHGDLAEIVKVEKRGLLRPVGTVFSEGGLYYLRPDDRAYFADIFIGGECTANVGDKALVEITRFPKNRCPEGKILTVIGRQFEFETEQLSLIYSKGVQTEFDEQTLKEAKAVKSRVTAKDISGRRDLRGELIFTIDGESARDFDDAVSLTVEDGVYVLSVHIADVSHYVKENSFIDKSAFERATSIYLPDRVLPMLPFELSNGICSLNEGVDRLTVTVRIKFDNKGGVVDTDIYKSVIKSTHRLTYTFVDKIIEGDEAARATYCDVTQAIDKMNELRLILENKRRAAGSIDLDVKESDITFENGVIEVGVHKQTAATKLIEQFMIAANEAVASFLFYQNAPCVYRVHESPVQEKVEQLKVFLLALGVKVVWRKDSCFPSDFQKLLLNNRDKAYFAVVNRMVLRSMQKAKYSPQNLGHFGLASKCYCHFTSPIRRYPDLVVHRILKHVLDGNILPLIDLYDGFVGEASIVSSKKEREADELERSVDDLYKTQYLSDKIGYRFNGIISSVLQSGFFVEIENGCEGFVPIELLPPGSYAYDKEKLCLSTHRRAFKIGDRVKICVLSADIASRRVDFCLA